MVVEHCSEKVVACHSIVFEAQTSVNPAEHNIDGGILETSPKEREREREKRKYDTSEVLNRQPRKGVLHNIKCQYGVGWVFCTTYAVVPSLTL